MKDSNIFSKEPVELMILDKYKKDLKVVEHAPLEVKVMHSNGDEVDDGFLRAKLEEITLDSEDRKIIDTFVSVISNSYNDCEFIYEIDYYDRNLVLAFNSFAKGVTAHFRYSSDNVYIDHDGIETSIRDLIKTSMLGAGFKEVLFCDDCIL